MDVDASYQPDGPLLFMQQTMEGNVWLEPRPDLPQPPTPQQRGRRQRRGGGYGFNVSGSLNTPQPTESGKIWGIVMMLVLCIVCSGLGIGGTLMFNGETIAPAPVAPAPTPAPAPVTPPVAAPAPTPPPIAPPEGAAARRLRLLWSSNYRWVMEPADIESIERDYRTDTGKGIDDAR